MSAEDGDESSSEDEEEGEESEDGGDDNIKANQDSDEDQVIAWRVLQMVRILYLLFVFVFRSISEIITSQ